jgi:MFS family permease
MNDANDRRLFWACFIALITTAFGFIVRALIMDDWARPDEFNLSATEKGEIFGVGLWPFAISIILMSLFIDRIGYGNAMVIAFICHVASAIITIMAKGYWGLYWGNFIVALGNGTVEAVINPVVATMFVRQKTKWLNILHAGWPGGLVLGGLLTIAMGTTGLLSKWIGMEFTWQHKVALILVPTVIYGVLMLTCRFPVNERVAAGVSDREMLREFGILGAFIVSLMIVFEVSRVLEDRGMIFQDWTDMAKLSTRLIISAAIAGVFGFFVHSLGRPMFIFLLLIMIPLATTELGTDSWITDLMKPQMENLGVAAGWVLVYTSFIMMVLRFFAGPIVHAISPLGLLMVSAAIAAAGLFSLSIATGTMILAAATLYGFGKTFFWPTMLGVVSEQFPRGGALTLNATGGVGMLAVGVVGAVFLGYVQDKKMVDKLEQERASVVTQVVDNKPTVFGTYKAIKPEKVEAQPKQIQDEITALDADTKKETLAVVAIFPVIMFVCYALLLMYFKSRGGYQQVHLEMEQTNDMLGAPVGTVEN